MKEYKKDNLDKMIESALKDDKIPEMPAELLDSIEKKIEKRESIKQLLRDYWVLISTLCASILVSIGALLFTSNNLLYKFLKHNNYALCMGAFVLLLYVLFFDKVVLTFLLRKKKN